MEWTTLRLVVYSGSAHHQQALANASISQQLTQGDQNANLADYRTLREKEKLKFPRDTMDVCITVTRYAILCQTLFQGAGPENPLVSVLWRLVTALQNAGPFIMERFQHMVRMPSMTSIFFASVLRAVQGKYTSTNTRSRPTSRKTTRASSYQSFAVW